MARVTKRSEVLATAEAAVVLCGTDAVALGTTAAALRERGLQVAIVLGEPDPDVIVEMVNELFPRKPAPTGK